MKELYILRHAEAVRQTGSIDDHDRGLTSDGEQAARRIAAEFVARAAVPDLILTSTARRAIDTCRIVQDSLPNDIPVESDRAYYLCGGSGWMEKLRRIADGRERVLVVGHNPGLHELAAGLCRPGESEEVRRLARDFPPAALACFSLPMDRWSDLTARKADLRFFLTP